MTTAITGELLMPPKSLPEKTAHERPLSLPVMIFPERPPTHSDPGLETNEDDVTMFDIIDRSRAHVALADLWSDPKDSRREAYATALSLYVGHEDLPKMLILADVLDLQFGSAFDIDFLSVMDATGLDADAIELVLAMAGARERGVRDWTSASKGEKAEPFVLTREEWRAVVMIETGIC